MQDSNINIIVKSLNWSESEELWVHGPVQSPVQGTGTVETRIAMTRMKLSTTIEHFVINIAIELNSALEFDVLFTR